MFLEGSGRRSDLLAAGQIQGPGQLPQVPGHLLQQHLQPVPDDVHLLLGLQAVTARGVDQQLQGHVLQQGHLHLGVQQLTTHLLHERDKEREIQGERERQVERCSDSVLRRGKGNIVGRLTGKKEDTLLEKVGFWLVEANLSQRKDRLKE